MDITDINAIAGALQIQGMDQFIDNTIDLVDCLMSDYEDSLSRCVCGESFEPTYKGDKYCSLRCERTDDGRYGEEEQINNRAWESSELRPLAKGWRRA